MDRREALKKLGIAGAVAAGGSVVLSSNSVAYAVSGACLPEIPESLTINLLYSSDDAVLTYSPGTLPGGVSTNYQWSNAVLETSGGRPTGVVRLVQPLDSAAVAVERAASANGGTKAWSVGDTYRVDLQITWSCPGLPSDVATYRVEAAYPDSPVAAYKL